jgi:uncharacterized protein with PIN domain
VSSQVLRIVFHGNLVELLSKKFKSNEVVYPLNRRATLKDIVESMGIPHTEVGKIEKGEEQLTFDHIGVAGEQCHIYPFTCDIPVLHPTILRPLPFSSITFMADDTVGKLRRNMRMAGLDTSAAPRKPLTEIAASATRQQRILVSRNRDLLKCKDVVFGQLVRSGDHVAQLREVFCRYTFAKRPIPFSRCLECNILLQDAQKKDLLDELQPLTRKYYFSFKKCPGCARIFWHGSHLEKMRRIVNSVLPQM